MAELKTSRNDRSVADFIAAVEPEPKRQDTQWILEMMESVTGSKPAMWGPSIIGFGHFTYMYKSGRTLDWFLTGFSPRKQNFSLYIMDGFSRYDELLSAVGKHKTGKSCLYIKRLDDIDREALRKLVETSVAHMNQIEKKRS